MNTEMLHNTTEVKLINRKTSILFHLLFWMVYIGTITLFFGNILSLKVVFYRTLISAFFNAILVYSNLYYLMPKYFEKRKYLIYLLLLHLVLLLVTFFRIKTDYYFRHYFQGNSVIDKYFFTTVHYYVSIVLSGYMILLLSMSLKFVKDYFINIDLRNRLKYQKVESELQQLKNQINPHFLFNVLGNIYSLAYMKSDIAPVMISKLSDMMRYVLYDCREKKVPLIKEINYLRDFIALHQLRKDNKMNISFEVEGDSGSVTIQPLLLLPLFENCFKHGNLEDIRNGWMKSKITILNNILTVSIQNSFVDRPNKKNKCGGVGLKNTRERLQLLYPGRHEFSIESANGVFKINLTLVLTSADNGQDETDF